MKIKSNSNIPDYLPEYRQVALLWVRFIILLVLAFRSQSVVAGDQAELLGSVVNQSTVVIVRIATNALTIPEPLRQIAGKDTEGYLYQWVKHSDEPIERLQNTFHNDEVYFAVDLPHEAWFRGRLMVPAVVAEESLKDFVTMQLSFLNATFNRTAHWNDISLRSQRAPTAYSLDDDVRVLPKQRELYRLGFNETNTYPIQVCVVFPAHIRKAFSESDKALPAFLAGGSAATMIGQVQWMSLGVNMKTADIRLVVETTGPETAEAIRTQIPQVLHSLLSAGSVEEPVLKLATQWIDGLNHQIVGSKVVSSREGESDSQKTIELVAEAITRQRIPFVQSQTQIKLKRMLRAIDDYHDSKGCLPTYGSMDNGKQKSGLSWRVHILPFIGHADLFNQFKLDEAWDSQHNRTLLNQMPDIFLPDGVAGADGALQPHQTTFVAPIGGLTAFGRDNRMRYANIIDGMSNTVAIVELESQHAIAWTSPEDYQFTTDAPAQKLRFVDGRTYVGMLDGSVKRISEGESANTWNALFTAQGGEPGPQLMK